MTRLFSYIIVSDTGDAPCVEGGLLTLATCKPRIRAAALVGDWVAGFHSVSQNRGWPPGRLVWLGQVSEVLSPGQYEFYHQGRRDAVYRRVSPAHYERLRPDYHDHPNNIREDVSAPVLIFDPGRSWYFGAGTPHLLPDAFRAFFASSMGHRTFDRPQESLVALISHMEGLDRTFGSPGHRAKVSEAPLHPKLVAYDGRAGGRRGDAFPYAGEGWSIGSDGRLSDEWLLEDE